MQTFRLILILVIFLSGAFAMISKKLPTLIVLPLMGILIAIVSGVPIISSNPAEQTVSGFVIADGAVRMASTIMVAIFGAILAKVFQKEGISEGIVRSVAELSGDNPFVIAVALTATTALIGSAMSGVGTVIMIAQIAIPLLISVGIQPVAAASIVLFGLNIGGLFNVSIYQMYVDIFDIDIQVIKETSVVMGLICAVITVIYLFIHTRGLRSVSNWAKIDTPVKKQLNPIAYFMPALPIVMVFVFGINAETSILITIFVTLLVSNPRQMVHIFASSIIEGIKDAAGVIGLMIGIGILMNGVTTDLTAEIIRPVISAMIPSNPFWYVVVFTLLSPLALYRGPLNMYGLGSGIATIFISSGKLSGAAICMALRATGSVQGISDPTNSQNTICASYANVDVNSILKSTLPYTMLMAFGSLVYAALTFF